jgi:hypothetical protein
MGLSAALGCRTAPLPASDSGGATGDAAVAADLGRACGTTCAACTGGGPCCGATCCRFGEWCDGKTLTCRCGDHPACAPGDVCTSGGGAEPLGSCGTFCCGTSTPCPI